MGSWAVLIVHLTDAKITWKDVALYRSGGSVGISVGNYCNHINGCGKTQTKTGGILPWAEITEKNKTRRATDKHTCAPSLTASDAMLPSSPCSDGLEPGTVSQDEPFLK